MSRGYIEADGWDDNPAFYLAYSWTQRAIKGKRGQSLLRDLADALDAMPEKRLVAGSFACETGVCALGALGQARGVDMSQIERIAGKIREDYESTGEHVGELNDAAAAAFDAARSLVAEIMWRNDDGRPDETPEQRWKRIRRWVAHNLLRGEA